MLTVPFTDDNVLGFIPLAVDNSAAEDPVEGPNSKRKRLLSAKGLELQLSDEGRTPATKNRSDGKSPKSSAKEMESAWKQLRL
jgi:COMPASS component SWD1